MTVAIVSCLYGEFHALNLVPAWIDSIKALERKPDNVIVAGDRLGRRSECSWLYPQAYYLNDAVLAATTDWVWILDIDDTALPDALNGIDDVEEDVWAMGYERSDGSTYIPPVVSAADIRGWPTSLIPGASAIRTAAFRACGGFKDVAFQDWALWRALAANGATFASSGRVNYRYNQHPAARSATELSPERRAFHLAEMLTAESGGCPTSERYGRRERPGNLSRSARGPSGESLGFREQALTPVPSGGSSRLAEST